VALVHRDDPATGTLQITATRPPGAGGVSGQGAVVRSRSWRRGRASPLWPSPGAEHGIRRCSRLRWVERRRRLRFS